MKLQWCQEVLCFNFSKNELFEVDYDVTELAIQFIIRLTFGSADDNITDYPALVNQSAEIILVLQGILQENDQS